jgi:hypothetical protein
MFGEEYKLRNFLQPTIIPLLLGQNILHRALLPNTLSLWSSSLNARDQILHSYRTTGNLMISANLTLHYLSTYKMYAVIGRISALF